MVAVYSQNLRIRVVPEELSIDADPSSVVCFSDKVLEFAAEWDVGEFIGRYGELSFGAAEEPTGFEVLNIQWSISCAIDRDNLRGTSSQIVGIW